MAHGSQPNLILLGPPGSGKSTQGDRLEAELGIPHISSGAMFRAIRAKATPLAIEVRSFLDRGLYIPDALATEVVLKRLHRPDARRGFILDGYPRTIGQVEALDEALAAEARQISLVFDIDAPIRVLTQRMLARAAAEGRTDDTPAVIETRLALYRQETLPLVEYYQRQGKLVQIDGSKPIDEVSKEIDSVISALRQPDDVGQGSRPG